MTNPLDTQVGGDHYKHLSVQPIEYIMANDLGFAEGCIVKYITRHKHKGKREDIKKIMHVCKFILKYEYLEGDEDE